MIHCTNFPADDLLSSYRFDLPQSQIAQHPGERGASRLLVVDRETGAFQHKHFTDLSIMLPHNALLVANNSRVIPARLIGRRPEGGRVEFLLLTPLPLMQPTFDGKEWQTEAEGLIRPSRRIHSGNELLFMADENTIENRQKALRVQILEKGLFGQHKVRLFWHIPAEKQPLQALQEIFENIGHLPLPPYIRRTATTEDNSRYQTVYARQDKTGSVAAPTAGLHFTQEMRDTLREIGIQWTEITLHVGYGTFSPVRCENLSEHIMHPEYVEIPLATADAVNQAKASGRPVFAVGTTSARALEGSMHDGKLAPFSGWVNLFIRPGFTFSCIDGLITNFHLPESTLLMLVSALTGRERMLQLYAEAVKQGYRFFSYGDAMLIR